MTALLWISLALVAFSYVGYPLALAVWTGLREALDATRALGADRDGSAEATEAPLPKLSIVMSAFDEEACIRAKVENCLALDYPPDRLEIVIGCDGCSDRTAQIARDAGGDRVRVLELAPRGGKASVLARLVPAAQGDVVVLTDANTMLARGAVRALARRFRDPDVGAAVGRLRLVAAGGAGLEEGVYWRYETLLKYYEGRNGCVLGANGGLYAIRRVLFSPLPADTIVDDFVVPLRVAIGGWRVPFVPDAVAFEEAAAGSRAEFARRARIGAGNWQALARMPELLDPRRGFLSFAFVSHKLLRWAAPALLAAALVANVAVAASPGAWGYRALLALHLAFYGLALAGGHRRGRARAPRLATAAHHFVAMNAALAVGFWRWVRGSQRPAWDRTERVQQGGVGAA
ncbi:MAG TPA: glycosyltransferase family 2 protein [Anaeromyxobacter sp.]|nr:glycosyltransferase family 2 protein [Anaeromyxobacter sp.]